MNRMATVLFCGFTLAAATPAIAQLPASPRFVGEARHVYSGTESPVEILSRLHKAGDWRRLQRYGQELITTLGNDATVKPLLGVTNRDYYNLVWVAEGDDGKQVVRRLLVHKGLPPQHASQLPGLRTKWPAVSNSTPQDPPSPLGFTKGGGAQLLDVYLTDATRASLTSTYVFTPVRNPLVTQLPDVIGKLNVLGFLGSAAGTAGDTANSILVYVNQPDLPMSRAKIQIKDAISTRITAEQLKNKAAKTLASVELRQARTSPCAKALAADIKRRIDTAAGIPACQNGEKGCADELKGVVEAGMKAVVPGCAAEPPSSTDPVVAVEQEFKKVVEAGGAQVVTGEAALTNAPPTRFTYGLMTALLIGNTTLKENRVKVDGNKIAKAPLPRSMTMVMLNMHPRGYDAEWPEVTRAERTRFFVGGVLTPDFGVASGVGFGVVRGLSVNTGAAWLFMETPKTDEKIGDEPKNGNDPFRTRVGLGGFIGLSYTFK